MLSPAGDEDLPPESPEGEGDRPESRLSRLSDDVLTEDEEEDEGLVLEEEVPKREGVRSVKRRCTVRAVRL